MATDWTQIPIVQKDMYDTWERFSLGNQSASKAAAAKFTNPSVPSDCVYAYDQANNRVYNTINTTSLVGLVCPDKRDPNFIFDGTLNVFGGGDNDPLGIVIAYVKLPNGETHTLTAIRTMFGQVGPERESGMWVRAPLTIVKDYMTHAPKAIAESFGVLKFWNDRIVTSEAPWVPAGEWNPNNAWTTLAPNGVRVRVVREGDIITVESSQLNSNVLEPGSKLTIDLSTDPDLEIFRGRCQYGFCSVSQDHVYWTGQVDHPKLATPFWLSDVHSMYGTHGWMNAAAEAGGIWKRNPVDLKDVFYKWARVSRGNRHNATKMEEYGLSDMAEPEECAAFTYDEATNRIGNPLNTNTLVGFLSPELYDSYLLDVTITSLSNWQVDPVGLVIAHTYDPDGTAHTLTIMRCSYSPDLPTNPTKWLKDDAPMQVSVDYQTSKQVTIAKGFYGLRYNGGFVPTEANHDWQHPGGPAGSTDYGFNKFPDGVRIRIDRNGDIITVSTSQYNDKLFWPGATLTIDLNSHPALKRFKGAHPYGFCCVSQDFVSWDATIRPGGWRRPFWMSEFGKKNDYVRAITADFTRSSNAAGSQSANYAPAKHETTNTALDTIVPLKHYAPADASYVFNKDCFAFGGHFTAAELSSNGFDPNEGVCISRPSMVDFSFMTGGSGEVGYYMFHKSKPFSRKVQLKTFIDYEMTSGRKLTYRLPQPEEDILLVPYIKSTSAVSGITVTIRNV